MEHIVRELRVILYAYTNLNQAIWKQLEYTRVQESMEMRQPWTGLGGDSIWIERRRDGVSLGDE